MSTKRLKVPLHSYASRRFLKYYQANKEYFERIERLVKRRGYAKIKITEYHMRYYLKYMGYKVIDRAGEKINWVTRR